MQFTPQISTGSFNRPIDIQLQSATQDAAGQPIQSWSTIYSCFASIDVQRSQQIYSTAEFIAKITYRINFRYTSEVIIQPNMRILYCDPAGIVHAYLIQTVENVQMANVQFACLAYELNGAQ